MNKEKLIFMAAALVGSIAIWNALVTYPQRLITNYPITTQQGPRKISLTFNQGVYDDNYYIIDGVTDIATGNVINRARNNPFAPFQVIPPIPGPNNLPGGEVAGSNGNNRRKDQQVDPKPQKIAVKLEFAGTAKVNGSTCGLIRVNGAGLRRVAPGAAIENCVVRHIEMQGIWLTDGNDCPIFLQDPKMR